MAVYAELFDGTRLEFPDGTDPSVISATAKRVTQSLISAQKPETSGAVPDESVGAQPSRRPEDFSALERNIAAGKRGVESLGDITGGLGLAGTAITGTDAETAAKMMEIKREQAKPQEIPGLTAGDIERIYKQKGLGAAVAQVPSYITEQVLQSAPQMAGPLAAGAGATALAAPLGPAAPVVGALVGIGAYGIQQFGNFLTRQAIEKNDPRELSLTKAAMTAGATAPLGYFADRFTAGLGGLGIKKAGQEILQELSARQVAAKVGKRAAVGASAGVIAEAPLEVLEQAAERFQAGLELTGDEATNEYKEAFFGAAAASAGIGGTSRAIQAYQTPVKPGVSPEIEPPAITPPEEVSPGTPPKAAPPSSAQDTQAMIDEISGLPPTVPPVVPLTVPPSDTAPPVGNEIWQTIQNRDRSTPASIAQMTNIANEPDYSRVSMSRDYGTGAPIVAGSEIDPTRLGRTDTVTGADGKKVPIQYGVIEAGEVIPSHNADGTKNPAYVDLSVSAFRAITNGRVAGLQAAYVQGNATDYRNSLISDDLHGVDKGVIEGMQNPMLVRVMPMDQVNKNTGDISNTGAGLTFNIVEQAKNDTNRIDLSTISFTDAGDVSQQTIKDFIKAMPTTEQGNLIDKQGNPTKQAIERVDAAIFQQAYGNDKLTELAFQAQDEEARNIVRALNMAASKAIRLTDAGDYDVRPLVNEAVEIAINARRNNTSLSDAAKQSDMTTNPMANQIVQMFADNPRSAKAIGENLSNLFDNAFNEGSKEGADMFGDVPKRPVDQLIKDSFAKKVEPDLFGDVEKITDPDRNPEEPKQFKSKKPIEQIAKEIEVMTDGSQVAGWLVENAPNEAAKAIADRLLVNIKAIEDSGVPIKIEVLNGAKRRNYYGSSGLADGGTKNIQYFKVVFNGLNSKGQAEYEIGTKEAREGKPTSTRPTGTRYSTLMHELLHVISQVQLDALIKRNFKGPEKIIYNELRSISNAVLAQIEFDKKNMPRDKWHPLLNEVGRNNNRGIMQDIHELFVRSLTEKNVQSYLSTVKMGKKTALTKLMEVFRKVIGLNPDYQSALDRIMIVSEKIFAQTPADIKRLAQTEGYDFPTMKEEVTGDVSDAEMDEVHNAQRIGKGLDVVPEDMFKEQKNPGVSNSNIFQYAAEHIGDLVHRLSSTETNQGGGQDYGLNAALTKASRNYGLNNALDQAGRNYQYHVDNYGYKGSKSDFEYDLIKAGKRYADAYRKIPVYTEFQKMARDAAIALGEFKTSRAEKILKDLVKKLEQPDVKEKYFERLKGNIDERIQKEEPVAEDSQEKPAATARNYLGKPVEASWAFPEDRFIKVPGAPEQSIDKLLYIFQDKQIDLKRAQEGIAKAAGEITDNINAYDKEQLFHGKIATGIRNFLLNELMPAIKKIKESNLTTKDMQDYLLARHAEERNNRMNELNKLDPRTGKERETPWELQDRASGMSTADARKYLAGLDPAKKQSLETIGKMFDKMITGTQNILVESGSESQATIDAWNEAYEHYMPLFRVEEDFNNGGNRSGLNKGFNVNNPFSKRAMGSAKEVQNIVTNLIKQRERALIRAEKLTVTKALYGLFLMNPNPDIALPVNPDAIKNKDALIAELEGLGYKNAEEIANNLMKEPKSRYISKGKRVIDKDTGLPTSDTEESVRLRIDSLARFGDNVLTLRVDGKNRYIFFNQENPNAMRMAASLKSLDTESLGSVISIVAKGTRWFANVNTQYNPIFAAVNLIRDIGSAQFNLTTTPLAGKQVQVTAGIFPAMRGIFKILRAERGGEVGGNSEMEKAFREFREEGGQTGYRDAIARKESEQSIVDDMLKKATLSGNALKAMKSVFGALSDFNDTLENSIRLSAYIQASKPKSEGGLGLSKQQAAVIAKNLTVNFDKKGQISANVNALYAFFNASIQGTARLATTLTGPKGKAIIGGGILLGSMQSILLAAAGFREDEPPEFVKQRNFIIPTPDGNYLTIPYPLGFNLLPNIGRLTTEFMISGGKNPAKRAGDLMGSVADAFSPIGSSGLSMQTIAPTVLDPLAALEANKDAFGRPIYKEDRATNPTPGYLRSRENASEMNKAIAYFFNLASGGTKYSKGFFSPTADELDYVVGQVTGGLGREIMKTGQTIKAAGTGEDLPAYRVPLLGRFYGETESNAAESQRFYNNITRMADHENEIKGRIKNKESVASYYKDNPEARLYQQANTIENQINALNKQKKEFIEKGLPKDRIKRIENQKASIMKRFNDQLARFED